MSNIVIKVEPVSILISPMGFLHYASEFLGAAQKIKTDSNFSPVPYYLVCRSIELALKAYLLAKNPYYKKILPKKNELGHNLENILEKTISEGLDKIISISPKDKEELRKANYYYSKKGFEYFELPMALEGKSKLPDIETLSGFASILTKNLKPICLKATDNPIK
ncbi:MAG: hypothetical protein GX660_07485 [Clostridiaceae bacterium]|nr:hypothetical protein [Clostridiaceae bacterium]